MSIFLDNRAFTIFWKELYNHIYPIFYIFLNDVVTYSNEVEYDLNYKYFQGDKYNFGASCFHYVQKNP